MADVVRYKLFLNSNKTIVEIFQREVGKTQRYMYIPSDLISKADASTISEIITNGGNIANACVFDEINGGKTFYFTWKVKESLKRAESKVFEDIQDFLRSSRASTNVVTASNTTFKKLNLNPFQFKVGDTFEDTSTKDTWTIEDIIKSVDNYVIKKERTGGIININRNVFEDEVKNGRIIRIFVNQPAQSVTAITNKQFNDKILDELQKVQDGDVVKTTRKKDGSVFNEIVVKSISTSGNSWSINGIDRGVTASLYKDYWEEVLKKGDLEVQIIKKGQAQLFKIGDKVKIRKDSEFYTSNNPTMNPRDTVGEIKSIQSPLSTTYNIEVKWSSNQRVNNYKEDDLELATQAQKFKVGDKIKIKKDSKFYGDGARNPKDKIGEITEIDLKEGRKLPIRVTWSDGAKNTYNEDDLEFYQGLNSTLKVVCILNEKQGIIEDLEGQESATGGGRVWNIFFNDGIELLCYRDEFFVEGDVLQLESPSYSPKILVNKISIPNNSVNYYLIEKATGNVGTNLEKNTIPDLFTFSIKLVDKVNISDIRVSE